MGYKITMEYVKSCLYCNGEIKKNKDGVEYCSDCKRLFWTIAQYEALTGKLLARDGEIINKIKAR